MVGPLAGRTVLIAASEDRVLRLADALRREGASVVPFPTVRLVPPEDLRPFDDALRRWAEFDWIVFTSPHGVDAAVARGQALGVNLARLSGRIAAVGSATKAALEERGLRVDAVPAEFLTDEIAAVLGDVRGKRILLPRSRIARKSLADGLKDHGAEVTGVDAYDAVPAEPDPQALDRARIDVIVFTSASAANNLAALATEAQLRRLTSIAVVAAIGPVTAEAARTLGFRVDVTAEEHTIPGLVKSLAEVSIHG